MNPKRRGENMIKDNKPATGKQSYVRDSGNARNLASHENNLVSATAIDSYWKANVRLLLQLLVLWFVVSFGCGILLVDALDQFSLFGFKVGFWFAQQGGIYVFVVLIFVYAVRMKAIDKCYGVDAEVPSKNGD